MVKDAHIRVRVTKRQKDLVQAIIDRLNSEDLDSESKKTLSYPYIFFILANKDNPNLFEYIQYLELKEDIEDCKDTIETLEIKLKKKEEKLKQVEDRLKNASLDSFKEIDKILNNNLIEATVNLVEKAKQRNITSFEAIPEVMFTATTGKGFSTEELKASVKKYYEEHQN